MDNLEKLALAMAGWSVVLLLANPFLRDRLLRNLAIGLAIGATVLWVAL